MTEQREYRAISLWRPWDQSILYGGKRIENRSWAPWDSIIGKTIVLHAAAKYDDDGAEWMRQNGLYVPPPKGESPTGLVGTARVTGCVTSSEDPWFFGPKGWTLDEVFPFARAIHCSGARGLWVVGGEILQRLLMAMNGEEDSFDCVDNRQLGFRFDNEEP